MQQSRQHEEDLDLKNKRTGLALFQISWIMAFVSLIVVNWQLRFQYRTWPPPDARVMDPLLPTVATAGLILSALLARRALTAIRHDDVTAFLRQWAATIGLGVAFVGIMVVEWLSASTATQYGVLFRVMTAFHGVHALAIGVFMVGVYRNARRGSYHAGHFWAVEGAAKLWYFVTIAWLLFYVVLYWI